MFGRGIFSLNIGLGQIANFDEIFHFHFVLLGKSFWENLNASTCLSSLFRWPVSNDN